MKRVIKILVLIMMIAGIAYLVACVVGNFITTKPTINGGVQYPDVEKAKYVFTVESTGNYFLTNSYETFGKVYVLHGYWERSGTGFKFRNRDLILDQALYGTITMKERSIRKGG